MGLIKSEIRQQLIDCLKYGFSRYHKLIEFVNVNLGIRICWFKGLEFIVKFDIVFDGVGTDECSFLKWSLVDVIYWDKLIPNSSMVTPSTI